MGNIANAVFQTLLGWIRTLAAEVWHTATTDSRTILEWISRNWIGAALILCAIGLAADLVVYLFRWQPYRVWRSFFFRIKYPENETDAPDESEEESRMLPDSEYGREDIRQTIPQDRGVEDPEMTTFEPEEEIPSDQEMEPQERMTASFERAILPRKRRLSRLFEEDREAAYAKPDELIDRYAAYRKPVYPRDWRNGQPGEGNHDERDA